VLCGHFAKFCHSPTKNATIGCDDRFCLLILGIYQLKLEKKKIVYLHFIFVFILLKLELCVGSFCSYLSAIVFSKNTWDKILKHFLLAFRLKLVKIVIIFLYLFRYPSFNFTWKSLHQGIKNLVKFSTIVTFLLKRMLDPQHPSWMNVANRQILVG